MSDFRTVSSAVISSTLGVTAITMGSALGSPVAVVLGWLAYGGCLWVLATEAIDE